MKKTPTPPIRKTSLCGKNESPKLPFGIGEKLEKILKKSPYDFETKISPFEFRIQDFRDIIEGSQFIVEDLKKISNPLPRDLERIKLFDQQILDTKLELWMIVVNSI